MLVLRSPSVQIRLEAIRYTRPILGVMSSAIHDIIPEHEAEIEREIEVLIKERIRDRHGPVRGGTADNRIILAIDLPVAIQVLILHVSRKAVVFSRFSGLVLTPSSQTTQSPTGSPTRNISISPCG